MSDEYTPDTDQVKYRYQLDVGNSPIAGRTFEEAGEEFERWLIRERAKIWREGFSASTYGDNRKSSIDSTLNPYKNWMGDLA